MSIIPNPIFQNKLRKLSWKKIYSREYGVQYSEMAILCLSPKAKYHIPKPSVNQVVIPEENNTVFYIDGTSWVELVESLNNSYTSHTQKLEEYERQFLHDGNEYLESAKRLARLNLRKLNTTRLKTLYLDYQNKLFKYSVFAWTSFILNNYISEKAKTILDKYLEENHLEDKSQNVYNSLFKPEKLAAVLELQYKVSQLKGNASVSQFNSLYEKFKWLACLDIHNNPWTKDEFKKHIQSFSGDKISKTTSFNIIAKDLKIKEKDLDYLLMAKRFVYIKDARDDFRRQGVYFALMFFDEVARRMGITRINLSYLQQDEVTAFLSGKLKINKRIISARKKGFVLYLGKNNKLVCLTGNDIKKALVNFKLLFTEEKVKQLTGNVASKGSAKGRVVIIKGVKDLSKVRDGDILVAVTTHPDYVSAMRKAGAIVTDEGGITSHAAIVSREFGIPCIVGTKNATSFLKDGDKIEVNAIEGKIKIQR